MHIYIYIFTFIAVTFSTCLFADESDNCFSLQRLIDVLSRSNNQRQRIDGCFTSFFKKRKVSFARDVFYHRFHHMDSCEMLLIAKLKLPNYLRRQRKRRNRNRESFLLPVYIAKELRTVILRQGWLAFRREGLPPRGTDGLLSEEYQKENNNNPERVPGLNRLRMKPHHPLPTSKPCCFC